MLLKVSFQNQTCKVMFTKNLKFADFMQLACFISLLEIGEMFLSYRKRQKNKVWKRFTEVWTKHLFTQTYWKFLFCSLLLSTLVDDWTLWKKWSLGSKKLVLLKNHNKQYWKSCKVKFWSTQNMKSRAYTNILNLKFYHNRLALYL